MMDVRGARWFVLCSELPSEFADGCSQRLSQVNLTQRRPLPLPVALKITRLPLVPSTRCNPLQLRLRKEKLTQNGIE